jgi:hypothetical protein
LFLRNRCGKPTESLPEVIHCYKFPVTITCIWQPFGVDKTIPPPPNIALLSILFLLALTRA